jgi:hypothetical protein
VRVDFNPSAERPDPASMALELVRHAVTLASESPLPLQALEIAHRLGGQTTFTIR